MISIARMCLALLLMMLSVHGACAADSKRSNNELHKLALVIGNAAYANAAPLANPVNDANDVCAALRKLDFDVICKTNLATKRDFKDAIFEFTGKITEQTVALFYFAGHGLQIDGLNYLIPVHAALRTKSDIEDESVQVNYLMTELEARRAALNIFVLDACRDNPFVSPIRGYAPTLGLASQLYAPRNSIIAMATGPGQLSLDGSGRNGTFTKNLLKFMPAPRQSVEDMFKAASGGTSADARRVGRQQDPQITTSFTEKFCLAGCADKRLAGDTAQINTKANELNKLQLTIAQTRAKQLELEEQKAALLKKQAELDRLKANLEKGRDAAQQKSEAASLNSEISAAAVKLLELDSMKAALLQKQEELNKINDSLSVQQAGIDSKNKEIRSRKIVAPEDTKRPLIIVPAF